MARPLDDETEEKPLDPAVERVRRKLVRFVGINLGILLVALMAVVGAIVYRSGTSDTPEPRQAGGIMPPSGSEVIAGRIPLPAGARLLSHALAGRQLSLDVELAGGARTIYVFDMGENRIVARYEVAGEE